MDRKLLFPFILLLISLTFIVNAESNTELLVRLQQLEDEAALLGSQIDTFKDKTAKLQALYSDITENDDDSSRPRRASCTADSQVAFHVRLTGQVTFSSQNEIVAYDVVHTNLNNSYDESSGVFTAPETGNYQFMATAMSVSGHSCDIQITAFNGNIEHVVCQTRASENSMGLCNGMVSLAAADRVAVRRIQNSGNVLRGGKFASFSGHLIPSI